MPGSRVWFITGASKGIGLETVHAALRAGDRVVATSRRPADFAESLGDHDDCLAVEMALPDSGSIQRAVDQAMDRFGQVDVLVNNAGYSLLGSVEELSDEAVRRNFDVNVMGVLAVQRAVLPIMRERRSGQIVNVSTTGVYFRVPRFSAYIASKAALEAFSDCVDAELARDGIQVSSIQMPLVRTPMIEPTSIYRTMPSLSPDQAAGWVCQAIVHRPRRVGTHLGNLAALADVVTPAPTGAIRSAGYQLFPDSRAAREKRS